MTDQADQNAAEHNSALFRNSCSIGFVRATELAAIAASHWRGQGDEMAADEAAAEALSLGLTSMPICAHVAVAEGTHSESDHFTPGQVFGDENLERIDIAVDPLEGTTLCAKAQNDALVVLAAAPANSLLNVPAVYMEKIAISAEYPDNLVSLDASPAENIKALSQAKKVPVSEIAACVLDRPRHAELIEDLREIGCAIKLIGDGDIAGVIHAANEFDAATDIYLGSGGAPEGVLAAAAIKCLGGFMETRFLTNRPDFIEKLKAAGIKDLTKTYGVNDLVASDVIFAATGVTNGTLVDGVQTSAKAHTTSSIIMESWSGTVRTLNSRHARQWAEK